jgi:GH24 family phage-related lysozyme (muramidase)
MMSTDGLAYLKRYEGFNAKVYNAGDGKDTIGYGFVIRDPSVEGAGPYPVGKAFYDKYQNGITEEQADAELIKILKGDYGKKFVDNLNTFIKENDLKPNQHQYDALLIMSYNIGQSLFEKNGAAPYSSDAVKALAEKDILGNPSYEDKCIFEVDILEFSRVEGQGRFTGLVERRKDELELLFAGNYEREYENLGSAEKKQRLNDWIRQQSEQKGEIVDTSKSNEGKPLKNRYAKLILS